MEKQSCNEVTVTIHDGSEGSDRWHKPLSGVIQKIHKHNTFTFHKTPIHNNFLCFSKPFLSKGRHSYNNATPRSHILKKARCVYWLQELQAELLQLQVQEPGVQEQLSGA